MDVDPAAPLIEPALRPDVEALKAHDADAWTAAFQALWPIALRAGQHPELRLTAEEAEEVASEALSHLVGRVDHVRAFDELAALAATIAYRRAVSVARRKSAAKRRPDAGFTDLSEDAAVDASAPQAAPKRLDDLELAELTALLHDALAGLDRITYTLLYEKIGLGMRYEELSAQHQLPLGTVCAKVARGLKKVRQHLQSNPGLRKELFDYLR